jgi:hypothetical protein
MFRKLGVATIFIGCALLLGSCGGRYYVGASVGPPAPLVETPYGVAPGADYIWTPGYYDWVGGSWVWRGGNWRRRPHPIDTWVAPRWEPRGNGYVRAGGGWQHCGLASIRLAKPRNQA